MNNTRGIGGKGPQGAGSHSRLAALAARIRAEIDRPIVLVGMMGVGKSTIGRKLAQVLALPFADADDAIIEAAQMPIADIFDQFGEDHFRDGERRVIARLLEGGPCVIATGGGAFVNPETAALIADKGITVWLDSDIDTLVERVGRNTKRPLLRGGNVREIVTRMKAEREPAYARATIKVMSDAGPHNATVNRILEALEECL
ncbi:shikimate kinase [Altererythrobacter sp. KTW20L]|uniref:shikimate kinase n=1 Tax=Altererythrobacter sp. KTW20L TaxID=2942210 RepID=UPI0020C0C3CE|nr:shikimate kinase [Altererythrobacter sp. KTW20L]MCL6251347.1 shikimate kinase [Altererythrobacter sp. KTW20L]